MKSCTSEENKTKYDSVLNKAKKAMKAKNEIKALSESPNKIFMFLKMMKKEKQISKNDDVQTIKGFCHFQNALNACAGFEITVVAKVRIV